MRHHRQHVPSILLQRLLCNGSRWFQVWNKIKYTKNTRWAPISYKWGYNPYKWPYKWVTEVITLLIGVITPFIAGRGPPCNNVSNWIWMDAWMDVKEYDEKKIKAFLNSKPVTLGLTTYALFIFLRKRKDDEHIFPKGSNKTLDLLASGSKKSPSATRVPCWQHEPRKKKNSYFPLYWLVDKDPNNGVLQSLYNWVV